MTRTGLAHWWARHSRRLVPPHAERRPDALALVDPPNRGVLHRRSTPPADLCTGRSRGFGDRRPAAPFGPAHRSLIALQVANTVECVLTLLAVLRAGLIAMPLPLLWRRAEIRGPDPGRCQGADRERTHRRPPIISTSRCRQRPTSSRFAMSAALDRSRPTELSGFDDLFDAQSDRSLAVDQRRA